MEGNKIAPKKEVKDESNPKSVVSKHPTSLNDAKTSLKPTTKIKVNENSWVEVKEDVPEASNNIEVSENLFKPKQSVLNDEVGEKETKNAMPKFEFNIVKGSNQRDDDVSPAKKADVKDNNKSIESVEETPSKPKTNFAKVDTKITMDEENKKVSNDRDVENVKVKEEPSNSIKSKNDPSKSTDTTTKEGQSKGKDAPKRKSKCRKVLEIIDKVGKKCWCPILVFIVLPLAVFAVMAINPQMSRGGIGGVSTHQFSHGGGSKDDEGNSGGGSQQAGKFSHSHGGLFAY